MMVNNFDMMVNYYIMKTEVGNSYKDKSLNNSRAASELDAKCNYFKAGIGHNGL